MLNKKGQYSTGFGWFVYLVLLVVGGLLYIIFSYVFMDNVFPVITNQFNSTVTNQTLLNNGYAIANNGIYIIGAIPIVLLFTVVGAMIFNAVIKKNRMD